MPESIRDGKGTGYLAAVTDENKLVTSATTTVIAHHTNRVYTDAYTVLFDKTPTGAGDCFFYLKNTNNRFPIIVSQLTLWAASDEEVTLKTNDSGTPSGGTAVVPANMTAGSTKVAVGTFESGVDITGLSGGTIINHYHVASATGTLVYDVESDIIIPINKTLTLYASAGAIRIDGSLSFWHDHGGIE